MPLAKIAFLGSKWLHVLLSHLPGGFGGVGSWGSGLQPSWEQKKDETLFASLFPISGMVSGQWEDGVPCTRLVG